MKQLKPMAALTLAVTISSSGVVAATSGDDKKTETAPTAPTPMSAKHGSQAISPQPQTGTPMTETPQSGMSGMQAPQSEMSGMQGPYGSTQQMMPEQQYGGMYGTQGQQGGEPMMRMRPWQEEQGSVPMMYGHPGGMSAPYAYHGGRPGMGYRGMRNKRMMGQFQEARQKHMQIMEERMAKIEELLKELVELTKAQKSSQ